MIFAKNRDLKLRQVLNNRENINTSLKFVYTNFLNKNKNVLKLGNFNNIKLKNFSKTKIVRRCILTNRSRGSIRPFNVSRVKLRELLQFGIIPGSKKAV